MPTVIIASTNPVKIEAARRGFTALFGPGYRFEGIAVPSGVSDQPRSDAETRRGARNRAARARQRRPEADFWVGIEGGIEDTPEGMAAFAWVHIAGKDLVGEARTGTFFLPPAVARLVRQGHELGYADDVVFQSHNSKQNAGAIGLLTDGVIDRTALYQHAVVLALAAFKNRELYIDS